MNAFDEQTDFSFLGISIEEPVKIVKPKKNWGTEGMSIGLTHNRSMSPEARAKISQSMKGKEGAWLGRKRDAETCVKISQALKGRPRNEMAIAKVRGQRRSDETKAKMRANHAGGRKARPIMTPNGVYPDTWAIAEAAGIDRNTVYAWMKKWPEHYYYIKEAK